MPINSPFLEARKLIREADASLRAGEKARGEQRTVDAELFFQTCEEKARAARHLCQEFGLMGELTVLNQLAAVLFLQKKYPEARQVLEERLVLAERKGDRPKKQDSLEALGRVCLELGHLEEARAYYQQALELFEERRAGLAAESHQITFTEQGIALYEGLVTVCLKQGQRADALEVVEQAKSRAFSNLLGTSTLRRPPVSPALEQQEDELLTEVREVITDWRKTSEHGITIRTELWSRWIGLRQELERVWQVMGQEEACAEYVALRRGTSPDLDTIRRCLA